MISGSGIQRLDPWIPWIPGSPRLIWIPGSPGSLDPDPPFSNLWIPGSGSPRFIWIPGSPGSLDPDPPFSNLWIPGSWIPRGSSLDPWIPGSVDPWIAHPWNQESILFKAHEMPGCGPEETEQYALGAYDSYVATYGLSSPHMNPSDPKFSSFVFQRAMADLVLNKLSR